MKWYYWCATAAYCAALFYLSSRQRLPDTGSWIPFGDKFFHAVAYGGLAAIVSVGIRRSNAYVAPRVQWFAPIVFAALYGLSDEIHQLYVPNRSADVWDLVADTVGAVAAQWVLCGVLWRIPLRHGTLS